MADLLFVIRYDSPRDDKGSYHELWTFDQLKVYAERVGVELDDDAEENLHDTLELCSGSWIGADGSLPPPDPMSIKNEDQWNVWKVREAWEQTVGLKVHCLGVVDAAGVDAVKYIFIPHIDSSDSREEHIIYCIPPDVTPQRYVKSFLQINDGTPLDFSGATCFPFVESVSIDGTIEEETPEDNTLHLLGIGEKYNGRGLVVLRTGAESQKTAD